MYEVSKNRKSDQTIPFHFVSFPPPRNIEKKGNKCTLKTQNETLS